MALPPGLVAGGAEPAGRWALLHEVGHPLCRVRARSPGRSCGTAMASTPERSGAGARVCRPAVAARGPQKGSKRAHRSKSPRARWLARRWHCRRNMRRPWCETAAVRRPAAEVSIGRAVSVGSA